MENDLRLIDQVNRDYDNLEARIPWRSIRDADNPLEFYGNLEFKRRFRLSKNIVIDILMPMVEHFFNKPTRRGLPVNSIMALVATLRFYATGSFQVNNSSLFYPMIPQF